MVSKEFEAFYTHLNEQFSCYYTKYVYQNHVKPMSLYQNVPNMPKFNEFMKKLVENKFYIWCVRGFDQKVMFNDYILPTAIYLYYMHVDLNQINKIHLYIVNDKTYKTYRENVGENFSTLQACARGM